ncbi:MAG: hypothetical protein J0I84_23915 [Terrimonas sp.]|nr:hypothetical protein [Terrimonas sp.]
MHIGNAPAARFGILFQPAHAAPAAAGFGSTHNVLIVLSQTSPHLDWYEGLDDVVNKLKKEISESWYVSTHS